jgi:hypothetical protein
VLLLHDNARPHTANKTNETLRNFKWEVLEHPPYSHDPKQSSPWKPRNVFMRVLIGLISIENTIFFQSSVPYQSHCKNHSGGYRRKL